MWWLAARVGRCNGGGRQSELRMIKRCVFQVLNGTVQQNDEKDTTLGSKIPTHPLILASDTDLGDAERFAYVQGDEKPPTSHAMAPQF